MGGGMDLFYSILIVICLGITAGILLYFKAIYNDKETRQRLKKMRFVFRWWLIGRYHCQTSDKTLKLYQALNRIFWGVVLIGMCLVAGKLVEALQWIL